MNIIYFAHSYRSEDSKVVRYFGELMQSEQIIASLDPPSKALNAAKLERHLRYADGMIAVLTHRDGGVSPHILYEISLCRRARKPLLVFVEDVLPQDIIPAHCMQRRFSRRSFLRHIREDRHAIRNFGTFVRNAPPRFQPSSQRRSCIMVVAGKALQAISRQLKNIIEERGYEVLLPAEFVFKAPHNADIYETADRSEVALAIVDKPNSISTYMLAVLHSNFVPLMPLTLDAAFSYEPNVPREYQPRMLVSDAPNSIKDLVTREFDTFEEDFLDLEDRDQVDKYASLLLHPPAPDANERGVYVNVVDVTSIKQVRQEPSARTPPHQN